MQHFRTQAVEHGEADLGSVLGRIIMDAERPLAQGHVDDLDYRVGDAKDVGIA